MFRSFIGKRGAGGLAAAAALLGGVCVAQTRAAPPKYDYRTECIKNNTGQTVNDLHVKWKDPHGHEGRTEDTKENGRPSNLEIDGMPGDFEGEAGTNGSNQTNWSSNQGWEVAPNGKACVKFVPWQVDQFNISGTAVHVDLQGSRWTKDGTEIPNGQNNRPGLIRVAAAPTMDINPLDGTATVAFVNDFDEAVHYSLVEIFTNNAMDHLTLDLYDQPTGSPVLGLPSGFTLAPGETLELPLGVVDDFGYVLATAVGATLSEPDQHFDVAASFVVPEPGTLMLLALGGLALVRRKTSHVATA